jgi:hypothetical protein
MLSKKGERTMIAEQAYGSNRSTLPPGSTEPEAEKRTNTEAVAPEPQDQQAEASWGANLFENHKGKLAVGAAAMLGLAVFYKWREGRLAKDDPEEYARLRRLKAAVGHDEPKAKSSEPGGKEGR